MMDVRKVISAEVNDFEDAVMIETAVRSGADCIVTRNTIDYSRALISVYAPEEFVVLLNESGRNKTE